MKINGSIRCPSCEGPLAVTQLSCPACELTLQGKFHTNEFSTLAEEDLHFLRIFILTEGSIRDMESALGVSYPTIKARLAQLKMALSAPTPQNQQIQMNPPSQAEGAGGAADPQSESAAILKELQAGRID